MSTWINFKELRAKLDFEQVLRHYHVEIKRKGEQHLGFCPLPNHQGNKNSPSFSANLKRGIFQCFGCGTKGNVLEFAAHMEKVDPHDGAALRKVALQLQEQFCSAARDPVKTPAPSPEKSKPEPSHSSAPRDVPVLINQPLDFELKGLERDHPYLLNRGFSLETIDHFGLGFCARGLLAGRVAIPLKDQDGKLIGYAGRVVDDSVTNEENPRYRFPGARSRDGKSYEFRKTLFLYNGHSIGMAIADLIVVEGFCSVWWLYQCHYPHTVATMGADCSEKQAELIVRLVKPGGRIWILPDGDSAGERFANTLFARVAPHRFVRWVRLNANSQPTDLSVEDLKALLSL